MAWLIPLLQAIAAVPKIGEMVMNAINAIVAWRMAEMTAENGQKLQDALAFGLRNSETKEGRLESAKKWQEALSRPRPEPAPPGK